jgi:two-component system, NarL family, nitrate/nitrite response regulator NarL
VTRQPRIRVYLADDHPVYLEGLRRAIKERPELELVGDSQDGREALAEIKRTRPDVALLDIGMPGLSGTQVLDACQRDEVGTRIVFLSGHSESDLIYEAMAKGALGYLSKLADRDAVVDAVAAVHRGETVLSPEFQHGLVGELHRRQTDTRPVLTAREREVLVLTAEGNSAPEIGQQLHLSTATVKTHLHTLYEKLAVSDRASAVAVAMRKGLLD